MGDKVITCRYCTFCNKQKPKVGGLPVPWIPPSQEEYYCLRTGWKIGSAGTLYLAPSWCPIAKQQKKNKGVQRNV